jgi:MOSC domain-containing protein YiiM
VNGRIVQISVSPGGLPKMAVAAARVTPLGLEGDGHRNKQHHGGPERAVCLFAMEIIDKLRAEGHAIVPGTIGENVTVQGLEWSTVTPGCHLRLGESVVLQVTRFTSPCTNIMPVFKGGDFTRVSEKRHPGWSRVYARVLATGSIRQGDAVGLLRASEVAEVTTAPSR